MQEAYTRFTETYCSKLPFLKNTAERVRDIQLTIEELVNRHNEQIFSRGKRKSRKFHIIYGGGSKKERQNRDSVFSRSANPRYRYKELLDKKKGTR